MDYIERIKAAEIVRGGGKKWRNIGIGAAIGTCNAKLLDGRPAALCFYWSLCVGDITVRGRELDELRDVLYKIAEAAEACVMLVVHDVRHFFQFVRKYFDPLEIFCSDERHPLDCQLVPLVFLRSGADLSGMTLQETCKRYGITCKTASKEWPQYAPESALDLDAAEVIDGEAKAMAALIEEHIKRAGSVGKIPLTKTGYVRHFLRDRILYGKGKGTTKKDWYNARRYREYIGANPMSVEEYKILHAIGAYGICEHSPRSKGIVECDPLYFDRKSAYAAHIVCDYVPDGHARYFAAPDMEDVQRAMASQCVAGVFRFRGIRQRPFASVLYVRENRTREISEPDALQARDKYMISADCVELALTELDFVCVSECYLWDSVECLECVVYQRGMLPALIRKYALARFRGKETAPDPVTRRVEKEQLNSIYGIMIQDPCKPSYSYDIDGAAWLEPEVPAVADCIEAYNNSRSRFTRYAWGIWIAAQCRRAEWQAWYALQDFFVYGDTDSIYLSSAGAPVALRYFADQNAEMLKKAQAVSARLGVGLQFFRPTSGPVLGAWCHDGTVTRLCVMGQKNYIKETKDGRFSVTMAGINPELSGEYVRKAYGARAVDAFSTITFFPGRYRDPISGEILSATGRKISLHFDDEIEGEILDALGERRHVRQLSGTFQIYAPITRAEVARYEEQKHNQSIDVIPVLS